jgi:hypothetical protein
MSDWVFDGERKCIDFIADSLEKLGFEGAVASVIATQIAPDCFEEAANEIAGFGLVIGKWAVRQEDQEFFDALKAAAVLGVSVFLESDVASPIVAAFGAAAYLAWNARRKGCRLNPLEIRILHELSSSGKGITIGELHERISDHGVPSSLQIQKSLADLTNSISRSGKIELVAEDSEGRWHPIH